MFEFELGEIEKEFGAEQGLILNFRALDIIRPVILKNNGIELEDVLWIFEDSTDALKSAVDIRNSMKEYNACHHHAKDHIGVSGYGVHSGEILFFEGTDIHWGDPVNTSSKLGQDLAEDGDILVMPCIYNNCKNSGYFQKLIFT